jgi:hypothetical protein
LNLVRVSLPGWWFFQAGDAVTFADVAAAFDRGLAEAAEVTAAAIPPESSAAVRATAAIRTRFVANMGPPR